MISKSHLRELIDQRLKDAEALFSKRRYSSAIYMAGYALELTLKLKICKLFRFVQGFPENTTDFAFYQNISRQPALSETILRVRDIRNHDLSKLLFYSGAEYFIKLNFLDEWSLAVTWTPEMRYKVLKFRRDDAASKIRAVSTLIKHIL